MRLACFFFKGMKNLSLLCLLILLLQFPATAQTELNRDSLILQLKTKTGKEKVHTLSELCWQFRLVSADKAMAYGKQALQLSRELKYDAGIGQALNDLGILYYDRGDYPQAMASYQQSLQIRRKLHDTAGIASLYNKIALIQDERGDYKAALSSHIKSLRAYQSVGDTYGISQNLNNIGIIHQRAGNPDTALTYFLRSLELKKKINDQEGYAATMVNIATVYESLNQLEEAISYSEKAKEDLRELGNTEYLTGVLNNLAIMYLKIQKSDLALTYATEAYQLTKTTGDRKTEPAALLTLGEVYAGMHRYPQASNYYNQALALAKALDQQPVVADAYELLGENEAKSHNYRQAYEMLTQYAVVKDSLMTTNLSSQLTAMQRRYEEQHQADHVALLGRQKEIKRLNTQQKEHVKDSKKTQLIFLAGLLAAVLIIAFLLYKLRQLKQRLTESQRLLSSQKERSLAVVEAEEKERKRIGADLHDGLGQLLSIARLNLSSLKEDLVTENDLQQQLLQNTLEVLDEGFKEVRTISHNLVPDYIRQQGLASGVQALLNQLGKTGRYQIHFEAVGLQEEPVPQEMEKVIYRVIQECLNNVIKHAQATYVSVQLIRHNQELTVMVEDNGTGFEEAAIHQKSGIGLKNIRSRIEYLNGVVHVDAAPNRGTVISIAIPINPAPYKKQIYDKLPAQHPVTTG